MALGLVKGLGYRDGICFCCLPMGIWIEWIELVDIETLEAWKRDGDGKEAGREIMG